MTDERNNLTMTPDEIFAALADYDYKLPEKALRAAESMPETMRPLLLERLEQILSNFDSRSDEDEWLEFYSLFLLAEFKVEHVLALLRPALDKSTQSSEYFEFPDGASKLFASWAFNNPSALKPFVDNDSYPEHIRSYALGAYIILYLQHVVSADDMQPYLHELAYEKLVRRKNGPNSWLWFSWSECCIVMGLSEFYPLIKKAFIEEWIDPMITDWEDMERDIAQGREHVLERARKEYGSPIEDVVESLQGWHCFTEAARKEDMERESRLSKTQSNTKRSSIESSPMENFIPIGTIVNTTPKSKPNQLCPCGSGKKYKKCCGRK